MELSEAAISAGHRALVGLYWAAPVVGLLVAVWPAERRGGDRGVRLVRWGVAGLMGVVLSLGLSLVFAYLGDGQVRMGQVALGAYFAMSLILILRGLDRGTGWVVAMVWWAVFWGRWAGGGRAAVIAVRAAVLMGLGLPWVMAAVMVYRPKVTPVFAPWSMGGAWRGAVEVRFEATDGGRVAAWYVPPREAGRRTVIVVHGLGANRGNQLLMARGIVEAGMGVLAVDLRAHGDSGGQLTTFGVTEKHDVLGAVRWLRGRAETAGVAAVGASLGGAAVLAAAGEDTAEGRAMEAVAVVGTYADLGRLMVQVSRDQFPGPLGVLLRNVGFPLAELHAGVRLRGFRPADSAGVLWPRPLLVVHGTRDEVISIDQGRRLFADAALPKRALWIEGGTHNGVVLDEGVAVELERFFATAESEAVVRGR